MRDMCGKAMYRGNLCLSYRFPIKTTNNLLRHERRADADHRCQKQSLIFQAPLSLLSSNCPIFFWISWDVVLTRGKSFTMPTFSQNLHWNCPQMWWLHYTSSLNFSVVIIINFIIITIITIIIIMRWSFWDVQGQLWQVLALRATAWPQQPVLINIVIIVILKKRPLP